MELFSIEHATNFIPCARCSAECVEAKERSPPRYANRTRHRRHPRETWFWHADSIQTCLSSTTLCFLSATLRERHSSRGHPLHARCPGSPILGEKCTFSTWLFISEYMPIQRKRIIRNDWLTKILYSYASIDEEQFSFFYSDQTSLS